VTGHNSEFKGFKTFWEVKEYMEGKGCPNFCFYMPNDDAHTTAPAAGSKGFYAVANGTHTGIYQNWE
jgi:viroplasmin and RNaseH domain-containing protein